MYQDQQCLSRQFYKEQCKEGEEGADERSIGRIISLSGQGLLCPWRPNGHHDYGIGVKVQLMPKFFMNLIQCIRFTS